MFRADSTEPLEAAPLAFELCGSCGLVRQDGLRVPRDYTNVQRPTARQFPAYGDALLAKLQALRIAPDDLIIEIGSNDSFFLERLRSAGFERLVGVEPSRWLAEEAVARGFLVLNDYFAAGTVARLLAGGGQARAIICRHTLEHVPEPLAFLTALRECLDPKQGIALVEVPDGAVIPEQMNVYDFWDEHLHYFCEANLVRLVERAGMSVQEVEVQPHLDTRNLLVWCTARPEGGTTEPSEEAPAVVALWREFAADWKAYRSRLIVALTRAPHPLYLLGASHRQYNFANYAHIGALVDYFIDDDPAKIGRSPPLAGGHPSIISTAEFEATARAGTVLKTSFGYPQWTARVCEHAASQGMGTVDPHELVEPLGLTPTQTRSR